MYNTGSDIMNIFSENIKYKMQNEIRKIFQASLQRSAVKPDSTLIYTVYKVTNY